MGQLYFESTVALGMSPPRDWVVERWSGGVSALHRRPIPLDGRRRLSILDFEEKALVLGSRGPDPELFENTIRRQSGGGIVWLNPQESTWIDVTLPRDDPLWSEDLGRSFLWLGETIAAAFTELGLKADIHEGTLTGDGVWCFDNLGAGEVKLLDRKLVGISQRRTKRAARFQCVWYRHFVHPPKVPLRNSKGIGWADAGLSCATTLVLDTVVSKLRTR